MKRTDPHRPGAIIPGEYSPVMSYALPSSSGGGRVPGWRVNCITDNSYVDDAGVTHLGHHAEGDLCCIVRMMERGHKFAAQGSIGKCSVCGAAYKYGDVWRHDPTGEHIHVGHDCADKYEMLMDRSAFELEMGRRRHAAGIVLEKARKNEQRTAFLSKRPGLAEALELDHRITRDIKARFMQWCELSDKQVAFVLKLHNEANQPKVEEKHVKAPTGKRIQFKGTIMSRKSVETAYGMTTKIVVKVETDQGSWLAYGTAPEALRDVVRESNREWRGIIVELRATLESSKDEHFVFMKRPTFLAAV